MNINIYSIILKSLFLVKFHKKLLSFNIHLSVLIHIYWRKMRLIRKFFYLIKLTWLFANIVFSSIKGAVVVRQKSFNFKKLRGEILFFLCKNEKVFNFIFRPFGHPNGNTTINLNSYFIFLNQVIFKQATSQDNINNLINKAWSRQFDLNLLQDQIDVAIADVQNGFFEVLKNSTSQALSQHETHNRQIDDIHKVIYERFSRLPEGSCRNTVQNMIDLEREASGFSGSNCMRFYDRDVTPIITETNFEFTKNNRLLSELQQIVVKAFIKQNIHLTPSDAADTMDKIFDHVNKQWLSIRPSLEDLRIAMRTRIGNRFRELVNCHGNVFGFSVTGYERIESYMYEQCENHGSKKISEEEYQAAIEDFKNFLESRPPYDWQEEKM